LKGLKLQIKDYLTDYRGPYVGLPVVKTTVSLLSHVHAKKIILAAAFAHSIDHPSCSAKSLITLVGAEN